MYKHVFAKDINGLEYLYGEDSGILLDGKPFSGVIRTDAGDIIYCRNGLIHREDGPAWIKKDFQKFWLDGFVLHPSQSKYRSLIRNIKLKIWKEALDEIAG